MGGRADSDTSQVTSAVAERPTVRTARDNRHGGRGFCRHPDRGQAAAIRRGTALVWESWRARARPLP